MNISIEILFSLFLFFGGLSYLVRKHSKQTLKQLRHYARLDSSRKEVLLSMKRARLYKLVMLLSGMFLFMICISVLVNEHLIILEW